ncbi:hypothetical protein B0H10DRAFT_2163248 [Mycena sp. CBHHK59/15]|nr:hypothetical protein B0H10DRAFT_2163248 [Mycena sp. CBHHK59/15]
MSRPSAVAILESPETRTLAARENVHAWLEPALGILWRELDSLSPLIGLFPDHLLKRRRRPGLGLITYDEISNNVSSSIFPIFEEYRPKTYLLPNLRHLTWKVTSPDNLDRASLFLTSELQGLVLHLGGAGTKFPTLPTFLADLGSRMKLLSFSITSSAALPDAFTELMLRQEMLEKLVIIAPGALSPTMGKWIASLPQLRSLQLDLSSRSPITVNGFFGELRSGTSTPDSVESHTDSGVFSGEEVDFTEIRKSLLKLTDDEKTGKMFTTLTHLQLTGQASNIAAFLAHLTNSLTQLDLVIEDPPEAADWRDLSGMICERFGSSLTYLRISATLSSKFGDLVRTTSRASVAPSRLSLEHLSPLPSLVRFSVDLPESVIFTASDEVRLCPLARFSATSPPQLALEDLAPLMSDCRRLNTLMVVINAKGGSAAASASTSSRSLLCLQLVAILLSHLAPHLEAIKWFTERNRPGFVEANARSWQKVSDTLPHLQNVRLTERKAASPQKEVVVEYVHVLASRPPVADKAVDATVETADRGVHAKPSMGESSVQVAPSLSDREIQASPQCVSVAISAVPSTVEAEVDATPELITEPHTENEDTAEPPRHESQMNCAGSPASVSSAVSLFAFLCRIFISYPLSLPLRMLHASFNLIRRTTSRGDVEQSQMGRDMALDTLNVRP